MADQFLTVDLGISGTRTFQTFEDLKVWAEAECSAWGWVNSNGLDQQISQMLNSGQVYARDNLRTWIANYPANPQAQSNIASVLASYFGTGRALLSTSPAGTFVLSLAKENQSAALFALAFLTGYGMQLQMANVSPAYLEGVMRAVLFRHGLTGTAEAEKEAMEKLHAEGASALDDFRAKSDAALKGHQAQADALREEHQALHNQATALLKDHKEALDAQLAAAQTALLGIERTYDEKLALQAPVTYWDTKARTHLITLVALGVSTLAVMAGAAVGITKAVGKLLPDLQPGHWPEPWRLGMILVALTMMIWVIRLMVKVTLSQIHLFTDAQERKVLITTYLSLLRSNQALTNEDRQLILSILFRSVATGIVEDGGPATPPELISRLLGGSKT